MINLDDDKDYFILIDEQGGSFGSGRIFEGLEELAQQFRDWADADDYEDPTLKDWTIGECLANWVFELKRYNGQDFKTVEYIENWENLDSKILGFKL